MIVFSKKSLFLIKFLLTLTLLQIKLSCAEMKDKDQDVEAELQKIKKEKEYKGARNWWGVEEEKNVKRRKM